MMEGPFTEMENTGKSRLGRVESEWIYIKLEHATLPLKIQVAPTSLSIKVKALPQLTGSCTTWPLLPLQTHLPPPSLPFCCWNLALSGTHQHTSASRLFAFVPSS